MSIFNTKISLRKDNLSSWTLKNPILKSGELAIVIDENNNEKLKIGNGISSFNQLNYLYSDEFTTKELIATNITTNSIAQGVNVKATPTSLATGVYTKANGNFDVVHGIEAIAKEGDDYAFVFNGENLPGLGINFYESHGEGTFNINPLSGLSGFYIGEKTLASEFYSQSDVFKTISFIKPYSDNNLYIDLDISKTLDFTSIYNIDSSVSNSYFFGFDVSSWSEQDLSGFGVKFNNCPINFKFRDYLNSQNLSTDKDTIFYARYRWYYIQDSVKHYSDYYSTVIPTNTEVGANSRDVVRKSEFEDIKQIVLPQSQIVELESEYFNLNNDKINQINSIVSSNQKICLENYNDNSRYYVTLSTENSTTSEISIGIYYDLGNGPELNKSISLKRNSVYNLEIFDNQIITQNINGLDFTKYTDSKIINLFKNVQIIKPYSENYLFVDLKISENKDFSNALSIDSAISNDCFYGLILNSGNSEWIQQSSQGFYIEVNNNPVLIDLEKILIDKNLIPTDSTILYLNYSWYYIDDSNVKHYSDEYSTTVPSNTEVGANNRDVASKREFIQLKSEFKPEKITTDLDDENYYQVNTNQYNDLSGIIDSNSKILLNSYDFSNTYQMKFTTKDQDANISVSFYVDYGNGPEKNSDLNINSNSFQPDSEYSIEIKNDYIRVNSLNKTDIVNYLKENSNSVTLKIWED